VIEGRAMRRAFRRKGGEVTGGWRKLHDKEVCNFWDELLKDEIGEACSMHERKRSVYKIFIGKHEG
jgi:hypothetical protein